MTILDLLAVASALGLVLVWVGYPAMVALAGGFRSGPKHVGAPQSPSVTIVIATRDDPGVVLERVRNCLRSRYASSIEIVVATDCRSPYVWDDVRALAGVKVVPGDEPGGKAATLNAGMRVATGEVVVFADTWQRFREDTVANLVARFSDPSVGAVTGWLRLPGTGRSLMSLYWTFERWLRRAEARVHSSVGATGAVYAIRRSLWRPLRAGLILDDVQTPMQIVMAGYRVRVADDAVAEETRDPTPRQEYGRKVRTLTGVLQLCAWCPRLLLPWRNPIWVFFVFHKLLRLLTPYGVALMGLALIVRAAAILGVFALPVLALAGGIGLWSIATRHRAGRTVRRVVLEGVFIQAAVFVAGFNGIRGRWQVWDA